MKKKNTIILILVIGLLLGCIAPIIPVCKVEQFFNLSNGKILERKTSLGIVYLQKIQDTDFSKLLDKFNITEPTNKYIHIGCVTYYLAGNKSFIDFKGSRAYYEDIENFVSANKKIDDNGILLKFKERLLEKYSKLILSSNP